MHSFLLWSFLVIFSSLYADPKGSEGKTLLLPVAPREQIERALMQNRRSALWSEDFSKALNAAQKNGRPLLLAFMGSGWCPWTEKLDREILSEPAFLDLGKNQMNLVWLNCPSQRSATSPQVQELKTRYGVDELPTLVVISPSQEEMFRLGYLPLTPGEFAAHLETMIADYRQIQAKIDGQDLSNLPLDELETLYVKARELNNSRYLNNLMQQGLSKDIGTFFLLEKYTELLKNGNKPEAELLREKIIERDPKNLKGSQLRLAILDFQTKAQNLKKKANPRTAVKPLLEYLQKFGAKDKENVWKVEMMMAKFLFTKNEVKEALQHANASYNSAPEINKAEIAETIDYLKTYLK